jgi:hypothetical protein
MTRAQMHGSDTVAAELSAHGLTAPPTLFAATFDILDRDRQVVALYTFPPQHVVAGFLHEENLMMPA